MEIKKIIREAQKMQFGNTREERNDKRTFMDGVFFACKRMENGEQVLKDLGYNPEAID